MDTIRQYLLSVICMAALCALVQPLFSGSTGKNTLIKLITGLMLTVAVLDPLLRDEVTRLDTYFDDITSNGDWAVSEGEKAAMDAGAELIKQNAESYILDKAAEMGAYITVDVMLTETDLPVPMAVTVRGSVSPYVKKQLARCLQQELGIDEGNQTWIS